MTIKSDEADARRCRERHRQGLAAPRHQRVILCGLWMRPAPMDETDDIVHQPVRLSVMAALTALDPADEGLDFGRLKRLTGATDGKSRSPSRSTRSPAVSRRPRPSSPAGRAPP
jgi:hypothetical protein